MAKVSDYKDFYIRGSSHPNYEDYKALEEESLIKVIVQKLEMALFTNKGDLYGDPYAGADLEYYLWSLTVPSTEVKKKVTEQIRTYIPELDDMGYSLDVKIYEGTLRDIMYLDFKINEYNIRFVLD
jgi:hypothetical protein